jgi:hypothetical protein
MILLIHGDKDVQATVQITNAKLLLQKYNKWWDKVSS